MSSAAPLAPGAKAVEAYLARLRDVLPDEKADLVVSEVSALIQDRLEQDGPGPATEEGTARALAALGRPEVLASAITGEEGGPFDAATRRAFTRMLAVAFAGHLLLSIVLTVVGADAKLVPGLVGALPRTSWLHMTLGVLGIFFVDVGFLVVLFKCLGRDRVPAILHHLRLEMPGSRRDAGLALVLVALLAVLLNVASFRDALFAVGGPGHRAPILAPDVIALLPLADLLLALFALRHLLILWTGGERIPGLALDALASLAGAVLAVFLMTRDQLVRIPESVGLSSAQAETFSDLLFRVVVIVGFVASLLLVTRFVKRVLRIRQLLSR